MRAPSRDGVQTKFDHLAGRSVPKAMYEYKSPSSLYIIYMSIHWVKRDHSIKCLQVKSKIAPFPCSKSVILMAISRLQTLLYIFTRGHHFVMGRAIFADTTWNRLTVINWVN